jgi:hypothetical protein
LTGQHLESAVWVREQWGQLAATTLPRRSAILSLALPPLPLRRLVSALVAVLPATAQQQQRWAEASRQQQAQQTASCLQQATALLLAAWGVAASLAIH